MKPSAAPPDSLNSRLSKVDSGYRIVIVILCALLLLMGVASNLAKYRSLGFQQRDYPFNLEFSAKLFDPDLTNRYSINPTGRSYLGFRQTDGKAGFQWRIHFAPVLYLEALLYRLFRTPVALFIWRSLIGALPPLYIGYIALQRERKERRYLCLLAIAYALLPANAELTSYDLRPYALLSPLLFMLFAAALYRRPLTETLILLIALFAVREEALLLAPLVLAVRYAVGRLSVDGAQGAASARDWPLWCAWLLAGIVTVLYYWLGGFEAKIPEELELFFSLKLWPLLALAVIALFVLGVLRGGLYRAVLWGSMVLLVGIFGLQFIFDGALERALSTTLGLLVKRARWQACWMTLLLFFLALWTQAKGERLHRIATAATGIVIGISAIIWCLPGASPLRQIADNLEHMPDARLVFEQQQAATLSGATVLCDYDTHQAFYDLETVYDYERLPWYIAEGDDRFYPQNHDLLVSLLGKEVDLVVVGRGSEAAILELAEEAGLSGNLHLLEGNATFVAYELAR